MVQIETERRNALKCSYSKKNPFLGKLICEDCGGYCGKKVCHSRRKEIVQCNNKFTKKCKTPTLTEDDVKARFIKAYNSMFINKGEMISNIELAKARIIDTTEIDNKISKLNDELQGLAKDIETLVKENTKTLKDQEIQKKKYAELEYFYKTKAGVLNDLTLKKKEKSLKANRIDAFTSLLKKGETLTKFDEVIFNLTLDKAVVHKDKSITFIFLSENEVTINDQGAKSLVFLNLKQSN